MSNGDNVRIGQLWVDNDPRAERKRFLRVTEIGPDPRRSGHTSDIVATCEAWYDEVGARSRTVQVRLTRFRATSNGYRLATADEIARELAP